MDVTLVDSFAYVERNTIAAYILNFEKPVVVDPGTANGAEIVVSRFKEVAGDKAEYIATTHVHLDHGGGSGIVAEKLDAKILVHPRGVRHLVNPEKLWDASKRVLGEVAELYGKPKAVDESRVVAVSDSESFDLVDDVLVSYHVPGHSPHSVAYYLSDRKILFPSDAVGVYFNDVYPVTPPPFRVEEALKSLERMMKLDVETVAFTHFGFADGSVIERSREKIMEWVEIAENLIEGGTEGQKFIEEFLRKIEDENLRKLKMTNPIAYSFFKLSALGMFECAKERY